DGMRHAHTPNIDRLMACGAYTMTARTVMPSVTLPCHTSMLRGVEPTRHGVTSNTFQPLARPVPSLLDAAHAAGLRAGSFFNWEELRDLAAPGSLYVSGFTRDCYSTGGDLWVARCAATHIVDYDLDLAFVYFGYTDECGHRTDWMSEPYLEAIAGADRAIGVVLDGCASTARETVALVLSDHGGHGRSHGTDCEEDMTIPWVLCGPGVKKGCLIQSEVRIFDTCPTLAHCLGLKAAPQWEGAIISEAFTEAGFEHRISTGAAQ
ncbi:MAG TPA: alkaline phosphatase family protein, partial [Chthonomonadales bacterium]|nr:alkaline phosphatase family protein [Chthonomonadales bacterium]